MLRIALGLFHFNTQYIAGDVEFADRYCREALEPFLEAIDARAGWRVSLAIAGSSLEFVADRHPRLFYLLDNLIERNKVELISSLYTPSIWIAFPRRDLLRSISLNRQCLSALGLKDARIFFAQEGFFGAGISALADHFLYALCKDEYLDYFSREGKLCPCYRAGDVRVIMGSNHLANLLASVYMKDAHALAEPHRRRLESVPANLPPGTQTIEFGEAPGIEWFWYHMGSGHHVVTPYSPEDSDRFFYDPAWAAMSMRVLDRITAANYRFGAITELADALTSFEAPPLPPVIEGSWNTSRSLGSFVWMGAHVNPWENDPAILGLAWQARGELVQREEDLGVSETQHLPHTELEDAWRQQLVAEASDPLGWVPTPGEVKFGRTAAERSLATVSAAFIKKRTKGDVPMAGRSNQPSFTAIELFGGDGRFTVLPLSDAVQQVDIHNEQTSPECGVRFRRSGLEVIYCPSAMEDKPVQVRFEDYRQSVLYLPLTNGFLWIGNGVSVIRVNRFGMTAARVSHGDEFVAFAVEGGRKGTVYRWRFLIHTGPVDAAVTYANSVNLV